MPQADVVILGGGPSGAVLALLLARAGFNPLLADPGIAPTGRIETLPPAGRMLARDLGLGAALAAAGLGRVGEIALDWRATQETRRPEPDEAPDLLDRPVLHGALRALAAQAGARFVRERGRILPPLAEGGCPVILGRHRLLARIVVDARGRSALPRARGVDPLFALPFHGVTDSPPDVPRTHLARRAEGWSWSATLPDGRIDGALYLPPARLAGLDATARQALLRRLVPDCGARVALSRPCAAALHSAPAVTARGPVLRIGDAALARNPLGAHGLTHAFRSAAHAAAAVATLLDPEGEHEAAYDFLARRHAAAKQSAEAATAQALLQRGTDGAASPRAERVSVPPPGVALRLSRSATRAPVLGDGRICWTTAVHLPRSGEDATRLGPADAATILRLLDPPAPLAVLAARLDRNLPRGLGHAILTRLIDEGALVADQPAEMPRMD